ncbi:MAG: NAD(P)H-dependent oxidoreductase [Novosphingobium sp.]
MTRIQLLGIPGSLRAGSFSTAILESLREELAPGADLILHPLGDVPLYNQDLDTEIALPGVKALRDAIAQADGLVIVTPEFNYGMPGVLKNALDWASRPYGAAPLIGKPVVTISASPAFTGGVRAQAQLNETLLATQSRLIGGPQVVIGEVHNKITDGRLTDRASLDFALGAVSGLVETIEEAIRHLRAA